jgi:hypothetical protein
VGVRRQNSGGAVLVQLLSTAKGTRHARLPGQRPLPLLKPAGPPTGTASIAPAGCVPPAASICPVHPVHEVGDLGCEVGGQVAVPGPARGAAGSQGGRGARGTPGRGVGQEAAQQRLDGALLGPQRQRAAEEAVEAARKGLRRRLRRRAQPRGARRDVRHGCGGAAAAAAATRCRRCGRQQGVQLGQGQPGGAGLRWLPLAAGPVCHNRVLGQLCEGLQQVLAGGLVRGAPACVFLFVCGGGGGTNGGAD